MENTSTEMCKWSDNRIQYLLSAAMSGSELLTTLLRLNYPKHHQLDGQSFDWMFENEAIAPFLEWFCHEVQPANLIDPRDMQE